MWQIPNFQDLKQDVEFFVRANAMRRFLLTRKTAKAGWIINVRDTTALDNMYEQVYKLVGNPTGKDIAPIGNIKTDCVGSRWMRWDAYTQSYNKKKLQRDVMHCNTLFTHNISYRYNAKTAAFVSELSTKDRFTQHCIINNLPWNLETYENWKDMIERDREWSENFRISMDSHY